MKVCRNDHAGENRPRRKVQELDIVGEYR